MILKMRNPFAMLESWLWRNEFRFPNWVRKWVFPGYAWSNLRHRTDIVRLPASPTEYHEYDWRLLASVFTLVSDFVEEQERNQSIDWEGSGEEAFLAWNSMREIRDWWRIGREQAMLRHERLMNFYFRWYSDKPLFGSADKNGLVSMSFTSEWLPKTQEDFEISFGEEDWKVFDEFFDNRRRVADGESVRRKVDELNDFVKDKDTEYLKKAIDLRERLWS